MTIISRHNGDFGIPGEPARAIKHLEAGMRSVVDNITAVVGGAQAGATPLTGSINRVVGVASAGDAVLLPPALAGQTIVVINAHASNSLNVFAAGATDIINALSNATAFAVANTKVAHFYCAVNGKWNVGAAA